MGEGDTTGGKRRNGLSIFLGIVGAVLGFVGALVLAPYNRMDPIASGLIALFVFGPIGAVAGAFAGVWLGNRGREQALMDEAVRDARDGSAPAAASTAPSPTSEPIDPGAALRKAANALFVVVVLGGVIGAFMYLNQKPPEDFSLNPGGPNPVLQFEVRLPAGAPMPADKDIRMELIERPHGSLWAKMNPDRFRRDQDHAVIVGEAPLRFRTADRQIQMDIAGLKDWVFYLTLPGEPPHAATLGDWQPRQDAAIRYRVKWPGKE